MTGPPPTYADLTAAFMALDAHPVLLRETIDGWLAWAVVKERLWHASMRAVDGGPAWMQGNRDNAAARVASGALQVLLNCVWPKRAEIAVLYDGRTVALPNGELVHPHLGRLALGDRAVLQCLYSWGTKEDRLARGCVHDRGVGASVAAISRLTARAPSVRRLAQRLAPAVMPALPMLPPRQLHMLISDQLARFRVRRNLFRGLLWRSGARALVVTDPDGKVGEVAAAKSLGLPVVEVQHGMFSSRDPDYSWTASHRAASIPLPVADRVIVFGPHWRNELCRAGYWRAHEIGEAVSPILGAYRKTAARRAPRLQSESLQVLFATQYYVRSAAIGFWREALGRQRREGDKVFSLRLKVHPKERDRAREYAALAEAFPESCSLAPPDTESFGEIASADLVAGYASMMLLEAVGLGIPAVSLGGGGAAEGFCATFNLLQLAGAIADIERPQAFMEHLRSLKRPDTMAAHRAAAAQAAATIFAFDGNQLEQAIADAAGL